MSQNNTVDENMMSFLQILHTTKTIKGFINVCKIFKETQYLFIDGNIKGNIFLKLRNTFSNFSHAYDQLPDDPYDMNLYLNLCVTLNMKINHLANYELSVLSGNSDRAFEYLKAGIFFSSNSKFAQLLLNKDEDVATKFLFMNSRYAYKEEIVDPRINNADDTRHYEFLRKSRHLVVSSILSEETEKTSVIKSLVMEYAKYSKDPVKCSNILSCLFLLHKQYDLSHILEISRSLSKSFQNYQLFEKELKNIFDSDQALSVETSERVSRQINVLDKPNTGIFDFVKRHKTAETGRNVNFIFTIDGEMHSLPVGIDNFNNSKRNFDDVNEIFVREEDSYCTAWLISVLVDGFSQFFYSFSMSEIDNFCEIVDHYFGGSKAYEMRWYIASNIASVNPRNIPRPSWMDQIYNGPATYRF